METPVNDTSIVEPSNLEQAIDFEPALTASEPSIVRVGDTLICSGSIPMFIPTGGAHVRQADIRLPLFAQKPTVTATVYTLDPPGRVFGIYNIRVDRLSTNQTRIMVSAGDGRPGVDVLFDYFCDFVVIGKAA